jgi:hypothetical protein
MFHQPISSLFLQSNLAFTIKSAAGALYSSSTAADSAPALLMSGAASGAPLLSLSSAGNLYGLNNGGGGGQLLQRHQMLANERPLSGGVLLMAPIPLAEFTTHIDRQKMNNSQGFIQVGSSGKMSWHSNNQTNTLPNP